MDEAFSLEGQLAVVTGGSRGIGFAIAKAFVAAGARVVITARNADQLREAEAALGPNAIGKVCDNADLAEVARTAEEAWRLQPVTILVNNAGVSSFYKRAEFVTVEDWDPAFTINVRGTFFWSTEVARRLFEAGLPGSIINISSVAASHPLERLSVYGATKAAMDQLTRSLALEWADRGVRVNSIAPGWVDTDFTNDLFASRWGDKLRGDVPMGRVAAAEDVTGAALYLASAASGYVTGSVMTIDGGRSLR
ncbi:MAG: SDR family oxidoreductase [Dehalococcoidia bacterium]|nr:SDR family oxidoreductase [Dehalococcoidia bacterium]